MTDTRINDLTTVLLSEHYCDREADAQRTARQLIEALDGMAADRIARPADPHDAHRN
jgi:hypothetical protein